MTELGGSRLRLPSDVGLASFLSTLRQSLDVSCGLNAAGVRLDRITRDQPP